tara:strand:- start:658 stop:1722 length:1065 start_codon:yes stop_codon:yes gene_type:complete
MAVYTSIDNPELYFQCKLYTGNGSTNAITLDGDENMQPDLVWVKRRNGATKSMLFDNARSANFLQTESSDAEQDGADYFVSLDSDGFTFEGSDNSNNASSQTYVAWCWKMANGTASNSNGTNITSTVSANTTAGQSIVSYSGSGTTSDTVGHGLSSLDFLIVKSRGENDSWFVKHKDLASSKNLNLNQTVAETDVTSAYSEGGLSNLSGNTFGFLDGTSDANAVNESSEAHIAYCFKSVQGYSKFGSFTGNGNASGTFVFCGFRPAWILIKNSSSVTSWTLYDNKRPGFNEDNAYLLPDASDNELSDKDIDLLSNGFKPRTSNSALNTSGDTYIFMAFAEAPFVNSKGVPANSR